MRFFLNLFVEWQYLAMCRFRCVLPAFGRDSDACVFGCVTIVVVVLMVLVMMVVPAPLIFSEMLTVLPLRVFSTGWRYFPMNLGRPLILHDWALVACGLGYEVPE